MYTVLYTDWENYLILNGLKSESADTALTSSVGWAKKDDRNGVGKTGPDKSGNSSTSTRPWASQRGVPGLNLPEAAKAGFLLESNRVIFDIFFTDRLSQTTDLMIKSQQIK